MLVHRAVSLSQSNPKLAAGRRQLIPVILDGDPPDPSPTARARLRRLRRVSELLIASVRAARRSRAVRPVQRRQAIPLLAAEVV